MSPQSDADERQLIELLKDWNLEVANQFEIIINNKKGGRRRVSPNPDLDATSFSNGINNPSIDEETLLKELLKQPNLNLHKLAKKIFARYNQY